MSPFRSTVLKTSANRLFQLELDELALCERDRVSQDAEQDSRSAMLLSLGDQLPDRYGGSHGICLSRLVSSWPGINLVRC